MALNTTPYIIELPDIIIEEGNHTTDKLYLSYNGTQIEAEFFHLYRADDNAPFISEWLIQEIRGSDGTILYQDDIEIDPEFIMLHEDFEAVMTTVYGIDFLNQHLK